MANEKTVKKWLEAFHRNYVRTYPGPSMVVNIIFLQLLDTNEESICRLNQSRIKNAYDALVQFLQKDYESQLNDFVSRVESQYLNADDLETELQNETFYKNAVDELKRALGLVVQAAPAATSSSSSSVSSLPSSSSSSSLSSATGSGSSTPSVRPPGAGSPAASFDPQHSGDTFTPASQRSSGSWSTPGQQLSPAGRSSSASVSASVPSSTVSEPKAVRAVLSNMSGLLRPYTRNNNLSAQITQGFPTTGGAVRWLEGLAPEMQRAFGKNWNNPKNYKRLTKKGKAKEAARQAVRSAYFQLSGHAQACDYVRDANQAAKAAVNNFILYAIDKKNNNKGLFGNLAGYKPFQEGGIDVDRLQDVGEVFVRYHEEKSASESLRKFSAWVNYFQDKGEKPREQSKLTADNLVELLGSEDRVANVYEKLAAQLQTNNEPSASMMAIAQALVEGVREVPSNAVPLFENCRKGLDSLIVKAKSPKAAVLPERSDAASRSVVSEESFDMSGIQARNLLDVILKAEKSPNLVETLVRLINEMSENWGPFVALFNASTNEKSRAAFILNTLVMQGRLPHQPEDPRIDDVDFKPSEDELALFERARTEKRFDQALYEEIRHFFDRFSSLQDLLDFASCYGYSGQLCACYLKRYILRDSLEWTTWSGLIYPDALFDLKAMIETEECSIGVALDEIANAPIVLSPRDTERGSPVQTRAECFDQHMLRLIASGNATRRALEGHYADGNKYHWVACRLAVRLKFVKDRVLSEHMGTSGSLLSFDERFGEDLLSLHRLLFFLKPEDCLNSANIVLINRDWTLFFELLTMSPAVENDRFLDELALTMATADHIALQTAEKRSFQGFLASQHCSAPWHSKLLKKISSYCSFAKQISKGLRTQKFELPFESFDLEQWRVIIKIAEGFSIAGSDQEMMSYAATAIAFNIPPRLAGQLKSMIVREGTLAGLLVGAIDRYTLDQLPLERRPASWSDEEDWLVKMTCRPEVSPGVLELACYRYETFYVPCVGKPLRKDILNHSFGRKLVRTPGLTPQKACVLMASPLLRDEMLQRHNKYNRQSPGDKKVDTCDAIYKEALPQWNAFIKQYPNMKILWKNLINPISQLCDRRYIDAEFSIRLADSIRKILDQIRSPAQFLILRQDLVGVEDILRELLARDMKCFEHYMNLCSNSMAGQRLHTLRNMQKLFFRYGLSITCAPSDGAGTAAVLNYVRDFQSRCLAAVREARPWDELVRPTYGEQHFALPENLEEYIDQQNKHHSDTSIRRSPSPTAASQSPGTLQEALLGAGSRASSPSASSTTLSGSSARSLPLDLAAWEGDGENDFHQPQPRRGLDFDRVASSPTASRPASSALSDDELSTRSPSPGSRSSGS